jgi:hypothetical protein
LAEQASAGAITLKDSGDDTQYIDAVYFLRKLPDLPKKIDSYDHATMDANRSPSPRTFPRSVEEDADMVLNPLWRDAFLAFMEFSHLPPERLLVYAQALLAAYPPAPNMAGPRYPLTVDTLGRWLAKMYEDPEIMAYRAECQASLDDPDTLACCLAIAPIESAADQNPDSLGTLIIAFERRSETLLHHLVRNEPTAMEILFVAEKLAQKAINRLGERSYSEVWRHLVLPWPGKKHEWSRGLYWLFEKNLPIAERALADDRSSPYPRCPANGSLDAENKLLKCRVQGRRFETRYDLWTPMYYGVGNPFPVIECVEKDGVNEVHDMLARAAVSTRAALRRVTPKPIGGNHVPTWDVLSRARRKSTA